jgi:hypothetical protein
MSGGFRARNGRRLSWWLLLFATPTVMAGEPDTPRTDEAAPFLGGFLTETRILYPLKLEAWEALGEHRFELAELGASVRYQDPSREDRWLDAYFYPAGVLPPDRLRKDVQQTVDEISSLAGRANSYERVGMGTLRPFVITLGKGKEKRDLEAYSVSMQLRRKGKGYHSAMVMLVHDMYYIKTRMTVEEDQLEQEQIRTPLEQSTTGLVRALRVSNTGKCWNPAPIVAATAPLELGRPGMVASADKDGVIWGVAYADRIEVLDPQTPQARVLQVVAGNAIGRIGPGCKPPEDMNPAVPEDMRELRFEYSAPKDDTDGTAPRLRGQRTGVG